MPSGRSIEPTMTQSQQIRLMLSTGLSVREIADRLDIRYQQVYQVYKQRLEQLVLGGETEAAQRLENTALTQGPHKTANTSPRKSKAQVQRDHTQQRRAATYTNVMQQYRDSMDVLQNSQPTQTIGDWLSRHNLDIASPLTEGIVQRLQQAAHELGVHQFGRHQSFSTVDKITKPWVEPDTLRSGASINLEDLRNQMAASDRMGLSDERTTELLKEAETNAGLAFILSGRDSEPTDGDSLDDN